MTENDIRETRRLALLRLIEERFNGNKAAFARAIGRAAPNVHRWLNRESKDYRGLDESTARDIESKLSLEEHELDFGAMPSHHFKLRASRGRPEHRVTDVLQLGFVKREPTFGQVKSYEHEDELSSDYIWIDRVDLKLSAGEGELQWVVHEKDPLAFRRRFFQASRIDPTRCRALYVRGKSMEPYLMDGDTVLIDTSKITPEDGEIFAVFFDDQYWIKAINIIPNGIRLVSLNPAFTSIDIMGDQLDSVKIIGKKIWRGG